MSFQNFLPHSIGFVIPVYSGETTLTKLVSEILELASQPQSNESVPFTVKEIILVHDGGSDEAAEVMRALEASSPVVQLRFLTRNFGQHPATIAGLASSSAEWVVTIDEDGQFSPFDVPKLLDVAVRTKSPLVYGVAASRPPHSRVRNAFSAFTKKLVSRVLVSRDMANFTSFRLIVGEIARGVAAYAGPGVYLDVALHWTVSKHETVSVEFRQHQSRQSAYTVHRLLGHFWRLVLSSGTKPLRFVSYVGIVAAGAGVVLAVLVLLRRVLYGFPIGFTSVFIALLLLIGLLLVSLGVISEYIGLVTRSTIGRPLYLSQPDPKFGPLYREPPKNS